MTKTQKVGRRFELLELFRRYVAFDVKLPSRRLANTGRS